MLTSLRAIYKEGVIIIPEIPENIKESEVIITFLDEKLDNESYAIMKLSEDSFSDWDNKEDEIYDTL